MEMKMNKVEPLPTVEVPPTIKEEPKLDPKPKAINISSVENESKTNLKSKLERNVYSPPAFLNFGFIFGFDFSYYPNNIWNSKRKIKFVISFIFLLISWVAFGAVLHKNYLCFLKRKSFLKPIQCNNKYVIMTNLMDASFGAVCSLAFFTNRGSISQLFYEALKPFYNSPTENQKVNSSYEKNKSASRRKIKVMSALLIILCVLLPPISVFTGLGLDIVPLFVSKLKRKLTEGSYLIANIPFVALSTYFCSMFSIICTVIQQRFRLLRIQVEDDNRSNLKYEDFVKQYQQCNSLVNYVEGIFSQTLPILLTLRAMSVIVWLMYLSWDEGPTVTSIDFIVRYPTIALHLTQVLLLLIQPARLNNKLAMPLMVPAAEKRSNWEIGVYTPQMYHGNKKSHYEFISRPAYVTAGGLRISAWFIVAIIVVVSAFLWVETNLSSLEHNIQKMITKEMKTVISAIPKPPPPPPPPPTCQPGMTAVPT
ncbi:hypothetical protein CHUAL_012106 [Chamberlinius hualienensis]